ncbi:DUF1775 domain-containing protein [Hoyosella subflava]|uniref:Argininosuccinate synthase n=1 Tax=Hoyosella subflava (strain DSM 45089 / JCM 17490 / NBRC 109087 / DQS3-9A1) TaxID=443218 RepID=F6ELQ4_HOYSD|nr:DUF1775 domain-containing protein [Hoyosella subflava]AEF41502.1 Argininosuccinate synthase [Hoyosella subflava DQS3-9A1]
MTSSIRRSVTMAAAVVLSGVIAGAPAAAHVLVDRVEPVGGGETSVVFAFEHGCEGDPTVALELTVPGGVEPRSTDEPDGWHAHIHGDVITWSGPPITDGDRAEFVLTAHITGAPGEVFLFPTSQRCEGGSSYHWADADPSAPEPAPSFIGTSATVTPPAATTAGASRGQAITAAVLLAVALAAVGAVARPVRR